MLNIQTFTCVTRVVLSYAVFVLIASCATHGLPKEESAGVGVQALNYSAREVSFIAVEDPKNSKNGGGGDALNPFGGGGTICCFSIPAIWRPDLQVVVAYQMYPETEYRRVLVQVPPYANNEAGDIWLIVHADESVEAVVSNYGPTRAEWPGKIKGYPVPSKEYRVKIWERDLKREKADLAAMQDALKRANLISEDIANIKAGIDISQKIILNLERNKP